jgi:hypothetical protein
MASEQTGGLDLCRLRAAIANPNTDRQNDARDFADLFHTRIVVIRSAFLADIGGVFGNQSRTVDGAAVIVEPQSANTFVSPGRV